MRRRRPKSFDAKIGNKVTGGLSAQSITSFASCHLPTDLLLVPSAHKQRCHNAGTQELSSRLHLWVHHVPVQAQGPAQQFNFSCLGIPFGWNPALAAVSHLSTLPTMSERVSISTEPRDEEEAAAFDQPRRGRGDLPPLDTSYTHSGGSSPLASPGFDPSDSTAALILVHDDEEESLSPCG